MENISNTEIELFLKLEKIQNFGSLKEAYLYLRTEASKMVRDILDHDTELRENLIFLATGYRRTQYVDNMEVTRPSDENEKKLIEISHLYFNFPYDGCGNIHMMLNLNNYANKKDYEVYSVFVYSKDGQDATYAEELSEDRHLEENIPDMVFFRQLPIFYALSQPETSKELLMELAKRKYSTPRYQYIDFRTGKIIPQD